MCYGCGPANTRGLHVRSFEVGGDLVADWQPAPELEAFEGVLNGGICGLVLDCHANWAAAMSLMRASGADRPPATVTANYEVHLLRPTPTDRPLRLRARVRVRRGTPGRGGGRDRGRARGDGDVPRHVRGGRARSPGLPPLGSLEAARRGRPRTTRSNSAGIPCSAGGPRSGSGATIAPVDRGGQRIDGEAAGGVSRSPMSKSDRRRRRPRGVRRRRAKRDVLCGCGWRASVVGQVSMARTRRRTSAGARPAGWPTPSTQVRTSKSARPGQSPAACRRSCLGVERGLLWPRRRLQAGDAGSDQHQRGDAVGVLDGEAQRHASRRSSNR